MKGFNDTINREKYQIVELFLLSIRLHYTLDNKEKKMYPEFMLIIISFMGIVGSVIAMYIDALNNSGPNYHIIAIALFFVVLLLLLIKPEKQRTQEQIKAEWKYKDYQAVYEYLDNHKPNLSYEQEDRESLAVLLFFDWVIEDDSNPDALVLTRVTTTSNDTQIFRPKNKKSL